MGSTLGRKRTSAAALLAALALLAGCGRTGASDTALAAKARGAVTCVCARDMVADVKPDGPRSVTVHLSVAPKDARTASAIASVAAGIVLEGVPEASQVAVRDSAGRLVETYSRP